MDSATTWQTSIHCQPPQKWHPFGHIFQMSPTKDHSKGPWHRRRGVVCSVDGTLDAVRNELHETFTWEYAVRQRWWFKHPGITSWDVSVNSDYKQTICCLVDGGQLDLKMWKRLGFLFFWVTWVSPSSRKKKRSIPEPEASCIVACILGDAGFQHSKGRAQLS